MHREAFGLHLLVMPCGNQRKFAFTYLSGNRGIKPSKLVKTSFQVTLNTENCLSLAVAEQMLTKLQASF